MKKAVHFFLEGKKKTQGFQLNADSVPELAVQGAHNPLQARKR
ncbi:MAG TPA: hypothetical protein PKW28_07885 [Turneriella sp.]|nr:hypothetical protein [Turneriella sp.]HNN01580.1 hypothetical protein [Turneriella sp.]